MDATNVLEKYFSYDSKISPYELFCRNVIAELGRLVVKKLNIDSNNSEVIENVEFAKAIEIAAVTDEFSVLVKLLDDFCAFLVSQKKIKHCYMQKNDLVAIVSTFKQVVENRQIEYFYSYLVMVNSAIEKNKLLKSKFSDANKLIEIMIRGSV